MYKSAIMPHMYVNFLGCSLNYALMVSAFFNISLYSSDMKLISSSLKISITIIDSYLKLQFFQPINKLILLGNGMLFLNHRMKQRYVSLPWWIFNLRLYL